MENITFNCSDGYYGTECTEKVDWYILSKLILIGVYSILSLFMTFILIGRQFNFSMSFNFESIRRVYLHSLFIIHIILTIIYFSITSDVNVRLIIQVINLLVINLITINFVKKLKNKIKKHVV